VSQQSATTVNASAKTVNSLNQGIDALNTISKRRNRNAAEFIPRLTESKNGLGFATNTEELCTKCQNVENGLKALSAKVARMQLNKGTK
jgi:ubiquinone biosynthesis protein UbiJ